MVALAFGTELTQIPFRADDRDVWRRTFQRAELLEQLGFDFASLGQHRFEPGWPSAPLTVLAAVAARTSTLRIGSGIIVLPLEHPVALAEQLATVDQISDGRVFLGVGIGNRKPEAAAMNVVFDTRAARSDEHLQVLRRLLSGEQVSFHGSFLKMDSVATHPQPIQRPHPPIWVAANFGPGFERAARLGDAYYGGTLEPLTLLAPYLERYRARAAELRRASSVVLKRPLVIGPDEATVGELLERWLPGATSLRRLLARSGSRWIEEPELIERLVNDGPIGINDYLADRAIIGTPAQCIEQVRRCRELTGCDGLQVSLNEFRDHPDCHDAQLRLFAEEVMPAFA